MRAAPTLSSLTSSDFSFEVPSPPLTNNTNYRPGNPHTSTRLHVLSHRRPPHPTPPPYFLLILFSQSHPNVNSRPLPKHILPTHQYHEISPQLFCSRPTLPSIPLFSRPAFQIPKTQSPHCVEYVDCRVCLCDAPQGVGVCYHRCEGFV